MGLETWQGCRESIDSGQQTGNGVRSRLIGDAVNDDSGLGIRRRHRDPWNKRLRHILNEAAYRSVTALSRQDSGKEKSREQKQCRCLPHVKFLEMDSAALRYANDGAMLVVYNAVPGFAYIRYE